MDEDELSAIVKDVSPPRQISGDTRIHFTDGRSYQLPFYMPEWEITAMEQDPGKWPDNIMQLLGYRMPDFPTYIEPPQFIRTPYEKMYVRLAAEERKKRDEPDGRIYYADLVYNGRRV